MTRLSQAIRWFFAILFGDGLKRLESLETPSEGVAKEQTEETPVQSGPSVDEIREQSRQEGALLLLGLLQEESRLLDFLMEDIRSFEDAQIGAAVRQVHGGASRFLKEDCGVVPARQEAEAAPIQIPFEDRDLFQLVGNVPEQGSVSGVLRHHGWKVGGEVRLPNRHASDTRMIVKAEVEVA